MRSRYCRFVFLALAITTSLVQVVAAQSPPSEPLTDEQIVAKFNDYMAAVQKVDGFSGSILVARDGKPIVSKGYGMASIELNVPNSADTVYRLGSVTKQFTAMAVEMLQEKGKLNVSDPLCQYIDECPEAWKAITLKHLLTHTAGVTNYTAFRDFATIGLLPTPTKTMVERLKKEKLEFVPGEKFSYSNSGYYLLGVVIEKASGKSYADFLQENIFTPLGMKHTSYDEPSRLVPNRAAGYQKQGGRLINAAYMDMTVPYAAGALYSTTGDLLIWDQALYSEKLVSRKGLDDIFTPYKGDAGYAFGWNIGKRFDRKEISHGGSIYGFSTHITRFPNDRVTVIVLSNVQSPPTGQIAGNSAAIVFGMPFDLPKEHKEVVLDPKLLERFVGDYQIGTNIVIKITLESGKLFGQLVGQNKFSIFPESETELFSKDVNAQFVFNKDASGQFTGFILKQGGGNTPAQKIKQ